MTQEFKIGDCIKARKRVFGVITDISDGVCKTDTSEKVRYYYFSYHNGMKVRTNATTADKLEKITKERFLKYIKESGNNSLLEHLK